MNRPVLTAVLCCALAFPAVVCRATPAPSIDIEITEITPNVHRTAPPHIAKSKPVKKTGRSFHRVVKPVVAAVKPQPVAPPVAVAPVEPQDADQVPAPVSTVTGPAAAPTDPGQAGSDTQSTAGASTPPARPPKSKSNGE